MNVTEVKENLENDNFGSYHALLIAFKTMKERCQLLQTRLAAVEEENLCLRLECGKDMSTAVVRVSGNNDKAVIQTLQEKVEDLKKQKSQLTQHVFMIAAENRHLWNRLTRLSKANKSLGLHFTKISDALKQHSSTQPFDIMAYNICNVPSSVKQEANKKCILDTDNGEKEQSLEEISLKLINSIILEKSDLEQQYAEMIELQNNSDLNLQNIGFTYPEDSDTDSLEQLKQHDVRLSQTKNALLAQHNRLKKVIENIKKAKRGGMCNNCRKSANKKVVHIGIQFDSSDNFQEHGSTQTSLPPLSLAPEKCFTDNTDIGDKICPLCGYYRKSIPFAEFHEHVLSHFTNEASVDGFQHIN